MFDTSIETLYAAIMLLNAIVLLPFGCQEELSTLAV